MPTISITATGFERRITEYAAEHDLGIKRGKVQRLAHRMKCRFERMTDLDRERLVTHSDPVPCEALHHILGSTVCRRCGQEPS